MFGAVSKITDAAAYNVSRGGEAPPDTRPQFSAEELRRRMIQRRAVEAMVWGMPAVNFELLLAAAWAARAAINQVIYWSRLPDWKNQTLTPNPDVIYLLAFIDTRMGPMVLEIPPADEDGSITGSIDDAWQGALEDVGPAGADKGRGARYLILPPRIAAKPVPGYIVLAASTTRSYAILRSNPASSSENDVARAAAYGKRVRLYPLAEAAKRPPTQFVDVIDQVFDSTIPYDLRFFRLLDRFVQAEPWATRDKAMIDTLKSIGIEKGKAFTRDAEQAGILSDAADEAYAWLDQAYEAGFAKGFFPAGRWCFPVSTETAEGMQTQFADPDSYPIDGRGVLYAMAYFSARHLGQGQYYLMTLQDRDGAALDGGDFYRLTVPAKPPVSLYWSATIYDRDTHGLIRGLPRASRASTSAGLQTNADGTVDLYFGPRAPMGRETNWVPTKPGGRFEVMFRFYGPQKALFDKSWVLPDLENTGSMDA